MPPDKNASTSGNEVQVCGIGASAGGIEALNRFFAALPADLGLAYVVVVHLAPDRKSELPAILSRRTKMPVVQVGDQQQVRLLPDHVFVIAPDRELIVTDNSVGAKTFQHARGHRMAIDLLFHSLAQVRGDGYAVVLSGTGSDGSAGAKEVKDQGGLVLVQDPADAEYGEMPRAAIATGVADVVLPVPELVGRLTELTRNKPKLKSLLDTRNEPEPELVAGTESQALREILEILRRRTGHDFSKYKRSTVLRRLSRRMQLTGRLSIFDYALLLRTHVEEAELLFADLLISVTSFFRDPQSWSALQRQVIGPLLEHADPDQEIRVWVPGCASGEEAYTVAMLFEEERQRRHTVIDHLLIFATDIDEKALATAREGLYPQSIATDVTEARLERFFRREDDHFRVASDVRDRIVFASHDLLRDPPFSRLHLISCRNLLIYLERDLQEQLMGVFRYALREDGHLFLGASETVDEDLFQPLDNRHRIFSARLIDGTRTPLPDLLSIPGPRPERYGRDAPPTNRPTAAEIHLDALEKFAPPSMLIDDRGNVVHVSPSAARFFQQGGGPPARRATDLVRAELRDELHSLINRALEHAEPQVSLFVPVVFEGASRQVAMLAQKRLATQDTSERILVTFLDGGTASTAAVSSQLKPTSELVRTLQDKLRQSEQRIETMRDEHFTVNEDLRAANEELQSLNEEYRSTTEELETSKEELQSVNEELQTVNNELKIKLEEVSRAHGDLENLMEATDVATLFLDPELRIKRFTPRLGDIFNIKVRDHERPIGDLTHSLAYENLEQDARSVLANGTPIEREVGSRDGRTFVAHLSPYRLTGNPNIDGVVLTFVDVTAVKTAETALRQSEARRANEINTLGIFHRMTVGAATAPTTPEALGQILAAALELHHADFGVVQQPSADSKTLEIVAQQRCTPEFLERFRSVECDGPTSGARAARERVRVEIAHVARDAESAPHREIAAAAGFSAVQSMPLIARDGALIAVLSVHFRDPHEFSERDKQLGELLGQYAAALIDARAGRRRLGQGGERYDPDATALASRRAGPPAPAGETGGA